MLPDPLICTLLVQIEDIATHGQSPAEEQDTESGLRAIPFPLRVRPWRHDLVSSLPPKSDPKHGEALRKMVADGSKMIFLGTKGPTETAAAGRDTLEPTLSQLHVGTVLNLNNVSRPSFGDFEAHIEAPDGGKLSGTRFLRCGCSAADPNGQFPLVPRESPKILNSVVVRDIPFSTFAKQKTLGCCSVVASDISLLAQKGNQSGTFDPPGTLLVLATAATLPANLDIDESPSVMTAEEFGKLENESPVFTAVITKHDAEVVLAKYVNPTPLKTPESPTKMTLENMFDDLKPAVDDARVKFEVYKTVVADEERPSLPSRRLYGVCQVGTDSPRFFEAPKRKEEIKIVTTPLQATKGSSPTSARSQKAGSSPTTPKKRSRRQRETHSSDEGSVGSLDRFVLPDDDAEGVRESGRRKKGTGSSNRSSKHQGKAGRGSEDDGDEESAHSDMYSLSSGESSPSEDDLHPSSGPYIEELDRDFVPRKKSRPTLLQVELR